MRSSEAGVNEQGLNVSVATRKFQFIAYFIEKGRRLGGKQAVLLMSEDCMPCAVQVGQHRPGQHATKRDTVGKIQGKQMVRSRNNGHYNIIRDICALRRYYAACSGNSLPTFRDDVAVPSSRFQDFLTFKDGTR